MLAGYESETTQASATDVITAISSLFTAVGVLLAFRQLQLAKRQALTTFEDQMAAQYRELIRRIPVKALLGVNSELLR